MAVAATTSASERREATGEARNEHLTTTRTRMTKKMQMMEQSVEGRVLQRELTRLQGGGCSVVVVVVVGSKQAALC